MKFKSSMRVLNNCCSTQLSAIWVIKIYWIKAWRKTVTVSWFGLFKEVSCHCCSSTDSVLALLASAELISISPSCEIRCCSLKCFIARVVFAAEATETTFLSQQRWHSQLGWRRALNSSEPYSQIHDCLPAPRLAALLSLTVYCTPPSMNECPMRSWDEERGRARLRPKMEPADGLLESTEGMEACDTAIGSSSESIWASVRFDRKESAILGVFSLISKLAEYNWDDNDQIRQPTPIAAPALYLSGCTTVTTNRGRRCVGCVVRSTSVALVPLYNGCGCVVLFANTGTVLLSCYRKQSVELTTWASVEFQTRPRLCCFSLISQSDIPWAFLRVVPVQQIWRARSACETLKFKNRLFRKKQNTRVGWIVRKCCARWRISANVGVRCIFVSFIRSVDSTLLTFKPF